MPDWEIAPNGSEGYRAEVIYRCPRGGYQSLLVGEREATGDIAWQIEGIRITHCPWCGNELFAVFDDIVGLIAEREKGERLVAANNDLIQI
jgi:hypothetical protein